MSLMLISLIAMSLLGGSSAVPLRGLQTECDFGYTPDVFGRCVWLDECKLTGTDYPCPVEHSFCQDRRPDDFGFKCGCQNYATPVLPQPTGTVMFDGESLPSIDGIPVAFRPIACIDAQSMTPSTTPIVEEGPTEPVNQCSRNCVNVGETCIASGPTNSAGKFQCTCLPGWTKTPGGGCTDLKQCSTPTLNDCGLNAMCVEIEGGLPGFACVCPAGFVGGAFGECYDPKAETETSAVVQYTFDNVSGIMNAEEKAVVEKTILEGASIDGFELTSVTITEQTYTPTSGRRLQSGRGRNVFIVLCIAVTRSTLANPNNFQALAVIASVSGAQVLASALIDTRRGYFLFIVILVIRAGPVPTPAPVPAPPPPPPPSGNRTRALLQSGEDGTIVEEVPPPTPQAIFPFHDGSLPSKVVYVTGPFEPIEAMESILQAQGGDIRVEYYDDKAMIDSVRDISDLLEEEEGITGAYDAFVALNPWAYRSDLWRVMILWANGGVYMDADLALQAPLDLWANLNDSEEVATCVDLKGHLANNDGSEKQAVFYQALMSAKKGSPLLLDAIRLIIDTVSNRRYGLEGKAQNDLAITGPVALGKAFEGNYDKVRVSCKLAMPTGCQDTSCVEVQAYVPVSADTPWLGLYAPMIFAKNKAATRTHLHELSEDEDEKLDDTTSSYGRLFAEHKVYCDDGDACLFGMQE